jgi:hypothetical protein
VFQSHLRPMMAARATCFLALVLLLMTYSAAVPESRLRDSQRLHSGDKAAEFILRMEMQLESSLNKLKMYAKSVEDTLAINAMSNRGEPYPEFARKYEPYPEFDGKYEPFPEFNDA